MAGNNITAINDINVAIEKLNSTLMTTDKNIILISKNIRKASKGFSSIKTPNQVNKKLSNTKQLTEQLTVALKQQQSTELALITAIEKKKIATESTAKALAKEKFELNQLNKGLRESAVLSSSLATEYQKQTVKLNQLIRKRQDLALKQELGIKLSKKEAAELSKLTAQIQRKDGALKKVDAQVGRSFRNIGNYGSALKGAAGAARNMASALGLMGGAFLVVRVIKDAIGTIKNFEKQNATLSGILQVTREEMTGLIAESQRLGAVTVKSAEEVVGLQIAYARLGFSQEEIINLTEATIGGSIALNSELSDTANLVGAMVNTFDQFSTIDAPEILDVLSLSTAKSALNFEKLQKGLPVVAGAANAAGIQFNTLIALMGKLSDAGIDVSTSSTALRNIFIKSKAAGEDYDQIIERIKGSQDKLTTSVDAFGVRAAVSATVLSSNIDATKELNGELNNAAGTFQSMADKELDTLAGALELLSSAWTGIILETDEANSISNKMKDTVRFLADNLNNIISTLVTGTKVWIAYKIAVFLAGAQSRLAAIKIGESAVASEVASTGVKKMTISWKAFNRALKANALFLVIAAVIAAVALFKKFNKTLKETADATKISAEAGLKQVDSINKSSEKVSDLVERYKKLKVEAKDNAEKQLELEKVIRLIGKAVPGAVTEIDKYGDALEINVGKTDDFIKKQEELAGLILAEKLKEATEELEKQQQALDDFNLVAEGGNKVRIDGIGLIEEQNGVLTKVTTNISRAGNATIINTALTDKGKIAYKEKALEIEGNVIALKALIGELDGSTEAQRKETEAKEKASLINQILASDKNLLTRIELEKLSIEELAKAYEDLNGGGKDISTTKSGTVAAISEVISALKKERDNLATTTEAYKSYDKAIQDAENSLQVLKNGARKDVPAPVATAKKGVSGPVSGGLDEPNLDNFDAAPEINGPNLELTDEEQETADTLAENKANAEQQIQDAAIATFDALIDLGNQLFDAKIANIDAEILANEEKFDKLIAMEEGNDRAQRRLALQKAKETERLEEKKKKEKKKQAIFNKAAAIVQIGINTAIGISGALTTVPTPLGVALAIIVGALGAVQTAAVAASPLPQFAEGKGAFNNYEGAAIWGEKKREMKISKDGKMELSPKNIGNHLTHVKKDDIIHPDADKLMSSFSSAEMYDDLYKYSILASVNGNTEKVMDYLAMRNLERSIDSQTARLTRALEENKADIRVNNNNSISEDLEFLHRLNDTL